MEHLEKEPSVVKMKLFEVTDGVTKAVFMTARDVMHELEVMKDEPDMKLTIQCVEMTAEEIKEMPEFDGW